MGLLSDLFTLLSRVFAALANSNKQGQVGTTTTTLPATPATEQIPLGATTARVVEPAIAELPNPILKIVAVSASPDSIRKWATCYPDEYVIEKSLTITPRSPLYIHIQGVYTNSFRLVAMNIRGQKTELYRSVPEAVGDRGDVSHEYESSWFPEPEPNGWSRGMYHITFSVESRDGSVVYDSVAIPTVVEDRDVLRVM